MARGQCLWLVMEWADGIVITQIALSFDAAYNFVRQYAFHPMCELQSMWVEVVGGGSGLHFCMRMSCVD